MHRLILLLSLFSLLSLSGCVPLPVVKAQDKEIYGPNDKPFDDDYWRFNRENKPGENGNDIF